MPSEHLGTKKLSEISSDTKLSATLRRIALEALLAPLPEGWVAVKTHDTNEIYFINHSTGESVWDDPEGLSYLGLLGVRLHTWRPIRIPICLDLFLYLTVP